MIMKREDIEFLKELQNELRTQTNDGNAQPVYWGVMEEREVDASEYCGEKKIHTGEEVCDLEDIVEHVNSEYDFTPEIQEEWNEVDKTDIDEVVDFCQNTLGLLDYEIVWTRKEEVLSLNTGAFLTKRACQKYIDNFGYNHAKPHTFAMTAYRNFELERLLNILTNMNIDDIKVEE